jgi:hypothetical protein
VVQSPGPALAPPARSAVEPRFGHDFSQVQVHNNARVADESARAVNATSFPMKSRLEQATPELDNLNQRSNTNRASQKSLTIKPAQKLRFSALHSDAMPGTEQTSPVDFASLLAQTTVPASAAAISEPEEGETVRLPDIVLAPTPDIKQTDAGSGQTDAGSGPTSLRSGVNPPRIRIGPALSSISSTLTYNPTITEVPESDLGPTEFGATSLFTHRIAEQSIQKEETGKYIVRARVDNPITFQVRASKGPTGQTDIASDSDPDITQANYMKVASDLTPDMSDLNGRPPKEKFWARDLTIKHERFHANEGAVYGRAAVTEAQNWLNLQMGFLDFNDVLGLVVRVPARVGESVAKATAEPAREYRAYGDSAPLYLARANAIKTKGAKGAYPLK